MRLECHTPQSRGVTPRPHATEPDTTNPKEKTMTATATMPNGKSRKQLSDEIDRLDGVIDVLAEGLPGAVTDACREGARAAVKDAIIEIVSNPELRALIAPQQSVPVVAAPSPVPPPEPEQPSLWGKLKAKLAAARDAVAGAATRAKEAVIRRCVVAGDAVVALGRATGETLPVRRVLVIGLSIGLVVGVATLAVPQTTAAVVSGVGAACSAVCVQVGNWLTRAARRVGLLS
jgi:hypothetical protein